MTLDERRGGDANYALIGPVYNQHRVPDLRIASRIAGALGGARSVLNVGAGTGSYEPRDRDVVAVEPSATMRKQRPSDLPVAIDASAERLPFPDAAFDASMTTFSVHQWPDLERGLLEMRRVTRGPVLVLTCDPEALDRFWLNEYAPEVIAVEARRYPRISRIAALLGPATRIEHVDIPLDCTDGFQEAYYGRPERFLDEEARRACSAWSFVDPVVAPRLERTLGAALADGSWDARHGSLRTQPELDGSLRLIVGLR